MFTASFDTAGRTMMGLTPELLAGIAARLPVAPLAYGANCASAPGTWWRRSWSMSAASPDDVLVAKGNCGIPTLVGDKVHYGGTPELMAEYVRLAQASGARIIGGCCGTSPSHILAMRKAVDTHGPRERPTIEAVEASLGPISRPKGLEGRSRTGRRGRSSE